METSRSEWLALTRVHNPGHHFFIAYTLAVLRPVRECIQRREGDPGLRILTLALTHNLLLHLHSIIFNHFQVCLDSSWRWAAPCCKGESGIYRAEGNIQTLLEEWVTRGDWYSLLRGCWLLINRLMFCRSLRGDIDYRKQFELYICFISDLGLNNVFSHPTGIPPPLYTSKMHFTQIIIIQTRTRTLSWTQMMIWKLLLSTRSAPERSEFRDYHRSNDSMFVSFINLYVVFFSLKTSTWVEVMEKLLNIDYLI